MTIETSMSSITINNFTNYPLPENTAHDSRIVSTNTEKPTDPKPWQDTWNLLANQFHDETITLNRALKKDGINSTTYKSASAQLQITVHVLEGQLKALAAADVKVVDHIGTMRELAKYSPTVLDKCFAQVFSEESDVALWDRIAQYIDDIDGQYVKSYENVVNKYTAFYSDFSKNVVAKLSECITPVDKKAKKEDVGKVVVNKTLLLKYLGTIKDQYGIKKTVETPGHWEPNPLPPFLPGTWIPEVATYHVQDAQVLYPKKGETATETEAKKWCTELGLPINECCQKRDDGTYAVVLSIAPIDQIIDSVNKLPADQLLDSTSLQIFQGGFNAMDEQLKNKVQVFMQKYSGANSTFDNLVKVLTSTITSCLEADKAYLHI